jgi:hypothetical protein
MSKSPHILAGDCPPIVELVAAQQEIERLRAALSNLIASCGAPVRVDRNGAIRAARAALEGK